MKKDNKHRNSSALSKAEQHVLQLSKFVHRHDVKVEITFVKNGRSKKYINLEEGC